MTPSFDPGWTQQAAGILRRAINKDGSFNVQRHGQSWRDVHPYLLLINASWPAFLGLVFVAYVLVNTIFAVIYFAIPAVHIQGADAPRAVDRFLNDFFFSAYTLTTVGYGNLAPAGILGNSIASLEALVGLLGFALATGLLFGRVAKPSARIGFSERVLIAPYQDRTSLQFRVVNRRPNVLIDLKATVILMTVDASSGRPTREFTTLALERDTIYFLPLTWTLVHPIDHASPLFNKTAADLARLQAEVLIIIKAFDDTFAQTVNARYSYRYDEMEWSAKFRPAFHIDERGEMVLNVDHVGAVISLERL